MTLQRLSPLIRYQKNSLGQLHGLSMLAVNGKMFGVLHNQSSSIACDEISSYWSASKVPKFSG